MPIKVDTAALVSETWSEGKLIPAAIGPYGRHTLFFVCDPNGSQTAEFRNGHRKYFSLTGITAGDGQLRIYGGHIIPRYKDPEGDEHLIMVIVHRPTLRYVQRRTNVLITKQGQIDLGPCGSLEFPGGSIEPGESVVVGSLRETLEETGIESIPDCPALRRVDPVSLHISEMIFGMHYMLVDLPHVPRMPSYVDNDGGIRTVRITYDDLQRNVRRGLVTTGSTLEMIRFLGDVSNGDTRTEMLSSGETVEERVSLSF